MRLINWQGVIIHAVSAGAVLGCVMVSSSLLVLKANPEIMLNDYPPDIRAAYGPMSARGKRQRLVVGLLLLLVLAAAVFWAANDVATLVGTVPFRVAFVYALAMFQVFNVVDLLFDFVLVWCQPGLVVLRGTEGAEGYRSYWFHLRGFFIGVGAAAAAALLAAWAMTALWRGR